MVRWPEFGPDSALALNGRVETHSLAAGRDCLHKPENAMTSCATTRCPGFVRVATAAALLALPSTSIAGQLAVTQLPCGTKTEMLEILTKTYGEREVAHGIANTGALAQLFVGPKGTWTIVATSPDGKSCLIGAGQDWERTTAGQNVSTGGAEEGI
jgi:hypothetical protein